MTERSLTIEYIIDAGAIGGAETQLVILCQRLLAHGHRPSVLFLQSVGPMVDRLDQLSIPYAYVRGPNVPRTSSRTIASASSYLEYRRFGGLSRNPVDIVHSMLDGAIAASHLLRPHPAVHIAGVLGQRIPKVRRADVAWSVRTHLLARNIRRSNAVVCNAPHLKAELIERHRLLPGQVHVIFNGVDVPEWQARPEVQPASGIVIANFHDYKGHDVLLAALSLLDSPPPVRLCGTGVVRDGIRRQADELGLSGVTFVEPPADIPAELRQAQFGIHPSRTEGLSNAILEEMSAGLPIVACDVGGNSQIVEHGLNGYLVAPGDPHALAEAIRALAADPQLRSRMGVHSRRRAEQLTWAACAGAHASLYEALASGHGA